MYKEGRLDLLFRLASSSWKKVDKVPNKYVEKVAVILGISNDEAILRNNK